MNDVDISDDLAHLNPIKMTSLISKCPLHTNTFLPHIHVVANLYTFLLIAAHVMQIFQRRGEHISENAIKSYVRKHMQNLRSTILRKSTRNTSKD